MKLSVLFEGAKEEAAIDLIRRTIAGTPYENKVWIAGGYVRDELMGKKSKDIDLVIDADNGGIRFAEWICKKLGIYKQGSNPVVYPRFGTAMFTLRHLVHQGQDISGLDIECVMPRSEENTEPGDRKSIAIERASIEGDALRRDLTINALYKNVSTGKILDPTGKGVKDIRSGVLRTPTDPGRTFGDPAYGDPLRMLRAIRFACRYGYKVDPAIMDAIADHAPKLENISSERIRDELEKMLLSPDPVKAVKMMVDTGLMNYVIPEMNDLVGLEQGIYHDKDAFGHTMDVLSTTPPRINVRLAALLHDIGKPETRQPHPRKQYEFIGHEKVGEEKVGKILKRLRFPNDTRKAVTALVRRHMGLRAGRKSALSDKALRRFARKCGSQEVLQDALALMRADYEAHPGSDPTEFDRLDDRFKSLEDQGEKLASKQRIVTGRDIMGEFGVQEGPIIGSMLEYAQELLDDDPSIDKETIMVKLREKFDPNEEE